jgi:hypothetical protein
MSGSSHGPSPEAQALFDHARCELQWLLEDGYTESRAELDGASFRLDYRSQHAAVMIGVYLFISEFTVFVGLPGMTASSGDRVDLRRILRVLGLPVPSSLPPNGASLPQMHAYLDGYLDGLRALRHDILGGDWRRYDRARDDESDRAWRQRMSKDQPAG